MSWIKNLAVITLSLMFSMFFLEIGLRYIYPNIVSFTEVRDHSDPFIPRHKTGSHAHAARNSLATFDTNGMRINPNQCEEQETVKALLVGDSNIAGLFLNDSETLGAKITEHSLTTDVCVSVDTFGVSGFGPDQTLFAIDEFTSVNAYDYVIFHIFADNDLGDLVRNNNFRNDRLSNNGYCFPERPLLERFVLYKAVRKALYVMGLEVNLYGKAISSSGLDDSCTIVLHPNNENFADSMHQRANLDWQVNRNNQRQIYMGDRYDIEFACNTAPDAQDYVSRYLDRIIDASNRLSYERNFELIYLIQPSEDDVTNNHPKRSDKDCEQYNPNNLTQFFVNALDGQNVINLYESFFECSACYFTEEGLGGDNHWSPYGVNIAATYVVDHIAGNPEN